MSRPIHVLLLPQYFPTAGSPGKGSFIVDLFNGLSSIGIDVGVIYPSFWGIKDDLKAFRGGKSEMVLPPTARTKIIVANYPRIPIGLFHFYQWRIVVEKLFNRYVATNGMPDIINAHGYWTSNSARMISKKYNIPYLLTEHGSYFMSSAATDYKSRWFRSAFEDANCVTAVSSFLAEAIGRLYNNVKIRVVPNGLDEGLFSLKRNQLAKGFHLLSVGHLLPIKGQRMLLRAFQSAFENDRDVYLTIVGEGPDRRELEAFVEANYLQDQVTFLGHLTRKDVMAQMQNSDALVISSSFETFSVVAIEALFTGIPIVSTKCGGPQAIIGPRDGWLVEKDNLNAMINGLLHAREYTKELDAEEIRRNAIERFAISNVSQKYVDLYLEALGWG